jgi:hypothetical protein
MSSTDFSFQNLVFWNLFEFSIAKNHLKINISHTLNPNLTNSIPLNLAHQDLSKKTKGTFQFLRIFQLQFNLIFNEKIIQHSRTFAPQVQTSWNQAHAPFLSKAFQRHQDDNLKHLDSMDFISTKQKKLPSFIDKFAIS